MEKYNGKRDHETSTKRIFSLITAIMCAVITCACAVYIALNAQTPQNTYIITPAQTPEPMPNASPNGTDEANPGATDDGGIYRKTTIVIDGEPAATLVSEEAAQTLLDDIRAHYMMISMTDNASIANNVELIPADGAVECITSDEAFALLTSENTRLRVECSITHTEREIIPFETKTSDDERLLRGTRIIETVGRTGVRLTVTNRVYVNGILDESAGSTTKKELTEPIDEVIRIGTLKQKDGEPGKNEGEKGRSKGDLTFIAPVKGSIKRNFGRLNGGFNYGLDYLAQEGGEVKASCGGTVVLCMMRGGYGLTVEIDHGNGFLTRYAHLKDITVSVGDSVEQGQVIGYVGSTGNAERAMLRFELRIDGVAYNPRYYLEQV